MSFPLRHAHNANILIGQGDERAALYLLPTVSYQCLSDDGKLGELSRMADFARSIGADFAMWRVSRLYDVEDYVPETMELLDHRHQSEDDWREVLEVHRQRLGELRPWAPELYLAVSLRVSSDGAGAVRSFGRSVDSASRRVEALAGTSRGKPLPDAELEALVEAEEDMFAAVTHHFGGADRADERDLQWLLRRLALRGTSEPEMDHFWVPDAITVEADGELAWEPLEDNVVRAADATLTVRARHLEVDGDQGSTHQAMLALGALPHVEFPSSQAELLFSPLEAVDFPVDAACHVAWIPNAQARAMVRAKEREIENKLRDQEEYSDVGSDDLDRMDGELAKELKSYLGAEERPPLLLVRSTLAVATDEDERDLRRRVKALRVHYRPVKAWQTAAAQVDLFMQHVPCPPRTERHDYSEPMTVERFGALMPHGDHRAGSDDGPYIGFTLSARGHSQASQRQGAQRPVRWNMLEASQDSFPSAVIFGGRLGSGKTIAAEYATYLAVERGSLGINIDPKGDHALHEVPEVDARLLELRGIDEYAGSLDPMRIVPPEERADTAVSYYLAMLREVQQGWTIEIEAAVDAVCRTESASSYGVIDELTRQGHKDAASALDRVASSGLGRLAFGEGGEVNAESALSTIRCSALHLPEGHQSPDTYTDQQRRSVATLGLLADLSLNLISYDLSRHKVVLVDEASFWLLSPQGRALISRLVRLGRAQNATILIATQLLGDFGDLVELVGARYGFGQGALPEAKRWLELLGLDPEDRTLGGKMMAYEKGRCLHGDLHGRVAEMQWDVPARILEILDTSTDDLVPGQPGGNGAGLEQTEVVS